MRLTWDRVLAWRLRRQFLDPRTDVDVVEIARRLCGVQAQVASSAELAVAARQAEPRRGAIADALDKRRLMKTWAMRGTLHVLPPTDAAAYLALLAASRPWEKAAWQRAFVTAAQLAALTEAVSELLAGRVLTRDELVAEVLDRTGDSALADHASSGWSAVLKPLAWQGHLCQGPSRGNRVTFTRPDTYLPDWPGLPDSEQAARVAIPAYLRAHGPADMTSFDQWLTRGTTRRATLRGWFDAVRDELTAVDVEGRAAFAHSADVPELAAATPTDAVRLLPGFDQYVLGPGTGDAAVVPAARRGQVSTAAGWIAPVVLRGGLVAGVWKAEQGVLSVTPFAETGDLPRDALYAETDRIAGFLGATLDLAVDVPAGA